MLQGSLGGLQNTVILLHLLNIFVNIFIEDEMGLTVNHTKLIF